MRFLGSPRAPKANATPPSGGTIIAVLLRLRPLERTFHYCREQQIQHDKKDDVFACHPSTRFIEDEAAEGRDDLTGQPKYRAALPTKHACYRECGRCGDDGKPVSKGDCHSEGEKGHSDERIDDKPETLVFWSEHFGPNSYRHLLQSPLFMGVL